MNPNSKKPGHLFFTPRTPWGTRAGQQSFRQHQRASEDKKPDPNSKEMQGLGGQMAPNRLTGSSGQPAQTGGSSVWKVPHTDLQPYQPQQQPAVRPPSEITRTMAAPADPATAEQMRQAGKAYRITPQKEGLFGGHIRGSFDYGRDRPKTEPTDGSFEGGYYSNPGVQDQLEEEKLRDQPIQPKTGEPPEARLPAYDEKKEKAEKEKAKYQGFSGPGPLG